MINFQMIFSRFLIFPCVLLFFCTLNSCSEEKELEVPTVPPVTGSPSASVEQKGMNRLVTLLTLNPDGSYFLAGSSNDTYLTDIQIEKYSASGSKVWTKRYGGSGGESASRIILNKSGGITIIANIWEPDSQSPNGDVIGYHPTNINEGTSDIWILKLDANGNLMKSKSLGGSLNDLPGAVIETNDGGLLVAGSSSSNDGDLNGIPPIGNSEDALLVKLDANLNMQWAKRYGGSGPDRFTAMTSSSAGGILLAAHTQSNDGMVTGSHVPNSGSIHGDFWIMKLSDEGSFIWSKLLGGSHDDYPTSILETTSGDIVVAGSTLSNDGDVKGYHNYIDHGVSNTTSDSWVVMLSPGGSIVWGKCLGGSGSESSTGLETTSNNDLYLVGLTESRDGDVIGFHGQLDAWVLKMSYAGETTWQKAWGGKLYDSSVSSAVTREGDLVVSIVTGSVDGDAEGNQSDSMWLVKFQ